MLEGQLLMFGVILLMFHFLVTVVLGQEGQEGVPELLSVVPGMLHQLIQLRQVGDRQVQALKEQQGG